MTRFGDFDYPALAAALNGALTPIAVASAEGAVEWANLAFVAHTGRSLDELATRPEWSFGIPFPTDHGAIRQALLDRRIWRRRVRTRRPDGAAVVEEATVIPVLRGMK